MQALIDAYIAIRDFLELGGPVLRMIGVVILVMWILILERLIFFRTGLRSLRKEAFEAWESRNERKSWHAHQIRTASAFQGSRPPTAPALIQHPRRIVSVMGLLVLTGMIAVFEVMGFRGTEGNPASWLRVSHGDHPTNGRYVGALFRVFWSPFSHNCETKRQKLNGMTMDH